jgi:hypothetical protein
VHTTPGPAGGASLAEGIPANLRDALAGLDTTNVGLVARAVLHAGGLNAALAVTDGLAAHRPPRNPPLPEEPPTNNPAGSDETTSAEVTLPAPGADNITGVLHVAADVLAHLARDPRVDTDASAFLAALLGTPAQLEDLIDVCRNQASTLDTHTAMARADLADDIGVGP